MKITEIFSEYVSSALHEIRKCQMLDLDEEENSNLHLHVVVRRAIFNRITDADKDQARADIKDPTG